MRSKVVVHFVAAASAEYFLFATDYPHEDPGGRMKFRDREIFSVNEQISEADKELILSGNAKRLFKLDTGGPP